MKEVLDGIAYLLASGYQHQRLACSNILIGLDGKVKIGMNKFLPSSAVAQDTTNYSAAGLEHCVAYHPDQPQSSSIKAVATLTMELMQKYTKDNVGIDNTSRWPVDTDAVGFLSSTTSAGSIDDLKQVRWKHRA